MLIGLVFAQDWNPLVNLNSDVQAAYDKSFQPFPSYFTSSAACKTATDAFNGCYSSTNANATTYAAKVDSVCSSCSQEYAKVQTECATELTANTISDIVCHKEDNKYCMPQIYETTTNGVTKDTPSPFDCTNKCHKYYSKYYVQSQFNIFTTWKYTDVVTCKGAVGCELKQAKYVDCLLNEFTLRPSTFDKVCAPCEQYKADVKECPKFDSQPSPNSKALDVFTQQYKDFFCSKVGDTYCWETIGNFQFQGFTNTPLKEFKCEPCQKYVFNLTDNGPLKSAGPYYFDNCKNCTAMKWTKEENAKCPATSSSLQLASGLFVVAMIVQYFY